MEIDTTGDLYDVMELKRVYFDNPGKRDTERRFIGSNGKKDCLF